MTDLFATTADIIDSDLPDKVAEDSFSLLQVLLGKEDRIADREAVFILKNIKDSAVAVCTGKWKLIVRYGNDQDRGNQLYDLSNDPGELNNVASEHPEVAERLAEAFARAEAAGRTRS